MSKDSKDASGASESFNLDKLKELFELMEKHGLTEVNLRQGGEQWRLRRGGHEVVATPVAFAPPPAAVPAPAAPAAAEAAPAAASNLVEIKSPIVGTFYSSPSPDDPAFVQVGATVGPDTVVCIVEAMKLMNEIEAEGAGTITAIHVENAQPVQFGQALFTIS